MVARQQRRNILASRRNKGLQKNIVHNQITTLPDQSQTINVVDSERGNSQPDHP